MASGLKALAESQGRAYGAINEMNLNGNMNGMTNVGEGIGARSDNRILKREAQTRGYVFGYVMGNAPAITLSLSRKTEKDGVVSANIVAKESKPSRCLSVLLALPAKCVKKNNILASPSDIMAGNVDSDTTDSDEMIMQAFQVPAAIAYISALGERLPEYAPNVSSATAQWKPADIMSGKPEVTWVRVHAAENKSRKSGSDEKFRFSLKSTSGRRSLYTENNIVCLRAVEHTSAVCKSEKDEYAMNEAAFGGWRYRRKKTETTDALHTAIAVCPSQIWNRTYEIDDMKKDGIGSAFFMNGASEVNESGETIAHTSLTYYPWYATGDQRGNPVKLTSMVKRVLRPAEGDKKELFVTIPVYYKDDAGNKLFAGYKKFAQSAMDKGYITFDKLVSLGARTARGNKRSNTMSPDQMTSLSTFLANESVEAAVAAVQEEAADRAVLGLN